MRFIQSSIAAVVLNGTVGEDSAPVRLLGKLSMAFSRKPFDRLPAYTEGLSSLGMEVPNKFNLGRTSTQSDTDAPAAHGVQSTPSILGKVRVAYEDMMVKTAANASTTSVVPVAKKLDRSLTLGSGFGTKVEVIPTETNLGFKLTKAEEQYLEHLRRRYDSRYA